jgi:Uma2 family endonuclease
VTRYLLRMVMSQPAWEIATLFPSQGEWTEEEYLAFSAVHPRVEFCDGRIEVLPVPSDRHQAVLDAILFVLMVYARAKGGVARSAGIRVRMADGRYREPDVVFLAREHEHLRGELYWRGADLAVEVLSPTPADRERDLEVKPKDYARTGIAEYWIADPEVDTLRVLRLVDGRYVEQGTFRAGDTFQSPTLAGLVVAASELFAR